MKSAGGNARLTFGCVRICSKEIWYLTETMDDAIRIYPSQARY